MILQIDWKPEFDRLKPYIDGRGGVARIDYRGVSCAHARFDSMLKEQYARGGNKRFSIRIDRDWFTTRMLEDVLREFERKLETAGHPVTIEPKQNRPKIGSENVIRGNASFTFSNVIINETPRDHVRERQERVAATCAALQRFLDDGGRAMIVVHHNTPGEQNYFWRNFWLEGAQNLIPRGLFLVYFVDISKSEIVHDEAPAPDQLLRLPGDWTDPSRQDDAYDDLYDVFKAEGMSGDAATAAAMTLLASSEQSVAAVYDNLFKILLRIGASAA